jgi:adenylosuccinate lyase
VLPISHRVALQHELRNLQDLDKTTDQLYLAVMDSLGVLCEAKVIGDQVSETEQALEWAALVAKTAVSLAKSAHDLYKLSRTAIDIAGVPAK